MFSAQSALLLSKTSTAEQRRKACPHLELRHEWLPHPRYGKKVPYCRSYLVVPGKDHRC